MRISHRVNREAVVVLGWGRAILLQLAHPLVAAGVGDHSGFDAGALAYLQRMRRTIGAMLSLTFGDESERRTAAGRIHAIHRRVNGCLPRAVGGYAAGIRQNPTRRNRVIGLVPVGHGRHAEPPSSQDRRL